MAIMTITLNPAIDQTITLKELRPGHLNKALSVHYNVGGKAINVASCLADWGMVVQATGLMGSENASIFEETFKIKKIQDHFIRVAGHNRTNIKLVDGTMTTDVNVTGIVATEETLTSVSQIIGEFEGTLVLAGSLPLNCPVDYYTNLLKQFSSPERRVFLDADGETLFSVLNGTTMPFCVKPNLEELSVWADKPLTAKKEILDQGEILLKKGIPLVVISLGEEGAFFLTEEQAFFASLKAPKVVSTVGAGDAMVAGILAALDEEGSLERMARLGTAFAVAKLGLFGPNLPSRQIIESFAEKVDIRLVE